MTPAVDEAKRKGIAYKIHDYTHEPANQSYGLEAAEKLGVDPERVFKTLIIELDNGQLAVAVIPVAKQLNLKLTAKAIGCKKAKMAEKNAVERSTGYVLGGVSPLGQKKRLVTLVDTSANNFEHIYISAGRRGLEIELSPSDLAALTQGSFKSIC